MGRRSVKENKNIYFKSREEAGLTRAEASEAMGYVSESRIDKIENDRAKAYPDDIVAMAEAYKKPGLCNYYCSHECSIGRNSVPEIQPSNLSELSLGIFNSLNALNKQKDRLMEIAEDGVISEDELQDFTSIQENLSKISLIVESLKIWVSQATIDGQVAGESKDQNNLQ